MLRDRTVELYSDVNYRRRGSFLREGLLTIATIGTLLSTSTLSSNKSKPDYRDQQTVAAAPAQDAYYQAGHGMDIDIAGGPDPSDPPEPTLPKYNSPEDAMSGLIEAYNSGDLPAYLNCLGPEVIKEYCEWLKNHRIEYEEFCGKFEEPGVDYRDIELGLDLLPDVFERAGKPINKYIRTSMDNGNVHVINLADGLAIMVFGDEYKFVEINGKLEHMRTSDITDERTLPTELIIPFTIEGNGTGRRDGWKCAHDHNDFGGERVVTRELAKRGMEGMDWKRMVLEWRHGDLSDLYQAGDVLMGSFVNDDPVTFYELTLPVPHDRGQKVLSVMLNLSVNDYRIRNVTIEPGDGFAERVKRSARRQSYDEIDKFFDQADIFKVEFETNRNQPSTKPGRKSPRNITAYFVRSSNGVRLLRYDYK